MTCKHCGTEIADKALICYRCGRATTEPRITPPAEGSLFDRPRRSRVPMVVVILIVLALLLALAWWAGLLPADLPAGNPQGATAGLEGPNPDSQGPTSETGRSRPAGSASVREHGRWELVIGSWSVSS
jgi:hypothetical protein